MVQIKENKLRILATIPQKHYHSEFPCKVCVTASKWQLLRRISAKQNCWKSCPNTVDLTVYHPTQNMQIISGILHKRSEHNRSNPDGFAFPSPSTTLTGSIKWLASRESGERKTQRNCVLFSDGAPHRPPTRLLCLPWNVSVSVRLSLSVPYYKIHQLEQKPVVMENNER